MTPNKILNTLREQYPAQVTEKMFESDHLAKVVQAYLDDANIDALEATQELTFFLCCSAPFFHSHIYKSLLNPISIDRDAAITEIRSAASHLSSDDPHVLTVKFPSLEQARQENPSVMDLSRPDNIQELVRMGLLSDALSSIADALDSLSLSQLTPFHKRDCKDQFYGFKRENLKEAGAAHEQYSAMRGLLVRELDRRIPDELDNRYSIIRHLAALAGVTMEKTYPRSLLLKGKT